MQSRAEEPPTGVGDVLALAIRRKRVQCRARERLTAPRPVVCRHDLDIADEQTAIAAPLDRDATPDARMVHLTHGLLQ
jgi:hypothetical protein